MSFSVIKKSENVSTYIDAVLETLRAYFSEKNVSCHLFNAVDVDYQMPAILLNVDKMLPGTDDGTGRFSLKVSISAFCIINREDHDAKNSKILRDIAADLMRLVVNNNFTCEDWVHMPLGISSVEHAFEPENNVLECVKVSWNQTIFLGLNIWDNADSSVPSEVYVSQSPEIGNAHEGDYVSVTENI